MKTFLLIVLGVIVVAGSTLTLVDHLVPSLRADKTSPAVEKPEPRGERNRHEGAEASREVLARIVRLERQLDAIAEMLQIPPLEAPESKPGEDERPLPVGLGARIQYLEESISDLQRTTSRDVMQLYGKLRQKLDEIAAQTRGGASSRRTPDLKSQGVEFRPQDGLVEMEAAFLQPSRTLEFIAVTEGGSMHESLLVVNAVPGALLAALDAMGLEKGKGPDFEAGLPPRGAGVFLYVSWEGRSRPTRVERLLLSTSDGTELPLTKFVYVGSRPFVDPRTWDEHLAANVYRSMIALAWRYAGDCVLACPLESARNENLWLPNMRVVPPPETKARLYVSRDPKPEWDQP